MRRWELLGALAAVLAAGGARADDAKAVERLRAVGRLVHEGNDGSRPVLGVSIYGNFGQSDRDLVHLKGLPKLRTVRVSGAGFTDAGLVHLAGLTGLETLDLSGTCVTDRGLGHLRGLTRLECLGLHNTAVTPRGLQQLRGCKALRVLTLGGPRFTGAGLDQLHALPALVSLELHGPVTDEALQKLKAWPRLMAVDLSFNSRVTEKGVRQLQHALPRLQVRQLSH